MKKEAEKRKQERQVEDLNSVKKEAVRKRNWSNEKQESLFSVSLCRIKFNSIQTFSLHLFLVFSKALGSSPDFTMA